uniref:Uncharacterized protein n=1 Tax=Knipowitschia caucasica TaxID=637954 RepID=A0AAV2KGY0_KNICA
MAFLPPSSRSWASRELVDHRGGEVAAGHGFKSQVGGRVATQASSSEGEGRGGRAHSPIQNVSLPSPSITETELQLCQRRLMFSFRVCGDSGGSVLKVLDQIQTQFL